MTKWQGTVKCTAEVTHKHCSCIGEPVVQLCKKLFFPCIKGVSFNINNALDVIFVTFTACLLLINTKKAKAEGFRSEMMR